MDKTDLTLLFKNTLLGHGFLSCGFSKAQQLEEEAYNLESWLTKNYHGEMSYMANHFDKRIDPTKLFPGTKSVISLLYNYYPEKDLFDNTRLKISKYAYGKDYHKVIKKKLNPIIKSLKEKVGDFNYRIFVDSAPVMEKTWAERSGLGWIGKNTNLLQKKSGSFFFIANILVDLVFDYDHPTTDHCGTCNLCVDACPTDALLGDGQIDGSKCISYYTIELKENFEKQTNKDFEGWIFGCDICQDICPWNRFSKPHNEPKFDPKKELLDLTKKEICELDEQVFFDTFNGTAVMRTKKEGLNRNINYNNRFSK